MSGAGSMRRGTWKGRRKGRNRKIAHDLRVAAPLLLLTFCFATSATAIAFAEWAPSQFEPQARGEDRAMARVAIDMLAEAIHFDRPR